MKRHCSDIDERLDKVIVKAGILEENWKSHSLALEYDLRRGTQTITWKIIY